MIPKVSPLMENQPPRADAHPFDARQLILRWLISTLAIFAAVWLVPGIQFSGPGWQLGVVALLFGLLNVLFRRLLVLLTMLTLGLFGLLINPFLLLATAVLAEPMGIDFHVQSFWAAFLGGLVVSIVTLVLSLLAGDRRVVVQVKQSVSNGSEGETDSEHEHKNS